MALLLSPGGAGMVSGYLLEPLNGTNESDSKKALISLGGQRSECQSNLHKFSASLKDTSAGWTPIIIEG